MPYTEFYEVAGQIVRREGAVKEEEEETSQLPTQQEEEKKKKIVQKVHPVLSVPTLEDEERTHFNVPTNTSSLSSDKETKKTEEELHLK
jgi:hypothetical protein